MSRPIILQSTLDAIDHVWLALNQDRDWREWRHRYYLSHGDTPTLGAIRQNLLFLNHQLEKMDGGDFKRAIDGEQSIDWLFYEEEHEVVPVYDEALAIVSRQLIIPAPEIPHLLAFMGVPGSNTGLDVENHDSKGYHFHYGKIKRDVVARYDVLLTFDKRNAEINKQAIPNIPLHIEPHAAGKCKHIDASTIGHNRRFPIYLVCLKAMESRGLENFLRPSSDSWQFYPVV